METTVANVLTRWCDEAENLNDISQHVAFMRTRHPVESSINQTSNTTVNEDLIVNILGSLTFVRNWYGFGRWASALNFDNTTEPIDRLIRFLQAHGIDI